jgi:hypothetical protein
VQVDGTRQLGRCSEVVGHLPGALGLIAGSACVAIVQAREPLDDGVLNNK